MSPLPYPKYGVDTSRDHFVRLTGPDGPPGLSILGPARVWNALIGTNGLPDVDNLYRVNPDGTATGPVPGNLVFTSIGGDLKLWVIDASGRQQGQWTSQTARRVLQERQPPQTGGTYTT